MLNIRTTFLTYDRSSKGVENSLLYPLFVIVAHTKIIKVNFTRKNNNDSYGHEFSGKFTKPAFETS